MVSRAKSRDAIDHAKFSSSSRDAAIRVYDEAGNVIETHEHAGEFFRKRVPEPIQHRISTAKKRLRMRL